MNANDRDLKLVGRCSTRATFVGVGLLLVATCSWAAPGFTITPAGVSTGYKGFVTLQISGLTNGETVKVAKFLDANNNGVVDGPDPFIQGFKLIDGQAALVAGATNFNTPGDVTVTDGAITAKLNFVGGGFDQQLVGNYAYVVSSPVGRFAPMTNWFAISNAAVVQSFTGTVRCSGTNVPYAVAMLFTPPSGNGGMNPVGGAVANSSGAYTVAAVPGTYMLWAFTSNFVADLNVAPVLTLGPGATITTNLTLVPATQTISGRIVDAGNTNKAIGGLSVFWMSANNEIASGFTDTNGNFTVGVTPGQWQFGGDDQVFSFLGYLGTDKGLTVDTTTGSVASVTIAVPKATSLIYGSVKDSQNQPIVGLRLEAGPDNGNGPFRGSGLSDPDGNYAVGVTAGTWRPDANHDDPAFSNYIFSKPFDTTNLVDGQAVLANITAVVATNHISGYVRGPGEVGVGNIGVNASATINGATFDQYVTTDGSGYYSMAVANGSWNVSLNCNGGNDSLASQGYVCVNNQTANVLNADSVLNFEVTTANSQISGFVRDTLGNPIPNAGVSAQGGAYNAYGQTDGTGAYSMRVPDGAYNVNVSCSGGTDSLNQLGYLCIDSQNVTVSNSVGTVNFSAVAAPYQVTGHVLNATNGPVAGVGVSANATINGTPYNSYVQTDASGNYSFRVANGSWSIGLNCNGGPDGLQTQGYLCVNNQSININNGGQVVNFSVTRAPSTISGDVRDNLGNPIPNVGIGAWAIINGTNVNFGAGTDNNGHYVMMVGNGTWNVNVACGGGPGSLDQLGYLCASSQNVSVTNGTAVANFTTFPAPYQISGLVLDSTNHPLANVGVFASAVIGGYSFSAYTTTDPSGYYHFSAANGSWVLGVDCNMLGNQGYLCPTQKTNTVAGGNLNVNFTVQVRQPLQITTTSLPNATVGVYYSQRLQASGGQSPYMWNMSSPSGPLPPGLNLSPDGTISGVPGNTGSYNFSVHASDTGGPPGNANQPLSITVNTSSPAVQLLRPVLLGNGQIQFSFNTTPGQNYMVEYTTDLANWSPLVSFGGTGAPITNSYPVLTGERMRIYRVHVGP